MAPSLTPYIVHRLSFPCVERRLRWIGILAQHFQLTSLHGWQEKVIAAVLDGRNSVVIQLTGSGKSLCFQLPPFLCEGKMAVVITPTISLMVDQATSLSDAGIPATYLGSAQSDKTIPQRIKAGEFKVVYVTDRMVECTGCLKWFHVGCVGSDQSFSDSWYCSACL